MRNVDKTEEQPVERLQALIEEIPTGVMNLDLKGKITYVNKTILQGTGYSREGLVGKNAFRLGLIPPESLKLLRRRMKDKLIGRPPSPLQIQFKRKDGTWMWLQIRGRILQEHGMPVGIQVVGEDITERKKAGEALADEATRRRILVDQSLDGIVVLDENGKVYEVNQRFAEMLGYTPEEAAELHVWDWDTQWTREQLLEMVRSVDAAGDHFETYHRRKDGTTIDVEISTNGAVCSGQKLVFCVCRDITDRKQAEEELQAEKNKLQSVIDAMEYGLTIQDKDYNIIYQNELVKTIFGDRLGEKCYRVYEGRERLCDGCPVEKAFRDGKSHTSERRVVLPSEEVTFWENTANPIRDARGRIISCLEINRNITERKKAEEALQESQEELRKMFESATDGISVIDLNGVITEVNKEAVRMHGFNSKDELLGKSALELVAPCDHERIAANMKKVLKQGTIKGVEYTLLKADGSEFPGELSTSALKDAASNWVGHITIARDITERKRAGEALERQKAYFQQLFDNSPEGIALLDDADRVVQVNKGFQTLFGYQTGEVKGRFINDLVIPEDRIEEGSALSRATLNGEARRRETVRKRKDGSLVDVSTLGYPIRFGNKTVGVYAIYSDITERKRAREALEESEKKYRTLFTESRDALFISSRDGKLIDANQSFLELFGYTKEEAIELDVRMTYVNPGDRLMFQQEMEKKRAVRDYELKLRKKDGTEIDCLLTATVRRTKDGSILGYHGFIHDITERKRAEEERRELEQKAHIASRLASVGEMASGIAHEINNPLTAVIGFAQLLMDADLPDDVKEDIGVIHKEAQRAAGVAKNLLTFARKQAPAKELINMNSIIEGVLKLRAYEQKVNNIHVNTHLDPKLPEVIADYSQMQQVFINIIINAETAMLEAHNRGTLTVTTKKVNNSVKVSFTDSGPGIAKENLNRIFDPFFTTKEVGKGTGLGLSVCHGIVAEHGGRIYARSKLGNGATFVVELPINAH